MTSRSAGLVAGSSKRISDLYCEKQGEKRNKKYIKILFFIQHLDIIYDYLLFIHCSKLTLSQNNHQKDVVPQTTVNGTNSSRIHFHVHTHGKITIFKTNYNENENYRLILHRIPEVNRLRTHCLKHYQETTDSLQKKSFSG